MCLVLCFVCVSLIVKYVSQGCCGGYRQFRSCRVDCSFVCSYSCILLYVDCSLRSPVSIEEIPHSDMGKDQDMEHAQSPAQLVVEDETKWASFFTFSVFVYLIGCIDEFFHLLLVMLNMHNRQRNPLWRMIQCELLSLYFIYSYVWRDALLNYYTYQWWWSNAYTYWRRISHVICVSGPSTCGYIWRSPWPSVHLVVVFVRYLCWYTLRALPTVAYVKSNHFLDLRSRSAHRFLQSAMVCRLKISSTSVHTF